ncbi:MAG: hypothetical protein E6J90_29460 [Deltaproteobacteria bacterium]|nr:MAG: hypothetical protein E6J90_29460 [Deltaproteobacteria bacterium]
MAFDIIIQVDGASDDELIAGAATVEVCERIGEPTTYQLEFALTDKDGDFPYLVDARLGAGSELTIATSVDDQFDVLCKGQVYGQRIYLEHNVTDSRLLVLGGDKTFEMDRTIVKKVWTGVKVSDAISSILSPYVDSATVDPIATKYDDKSHELVQVETDLRFVRRLARRYGHWFRVATDANARTTAYFQRPALDGDPVATLKINAATDTNIDAIEIEWDVERPAVVTGDQLPLRGKDAFAGDLDRSPLTPLGSLAFFDIATNRKQLRVVAPLDDAGDFTPRSEAALIEGAWFTRAKGRAAVRVLKAVLHTHTVIALNGAGTRHSGKYVVSAVRHVIDAENHTMHFELIRNAWEA